MEDKFQEWIDIAEEDLSTAEVCVNAGKYLWGIVMCQQTIEKMLKGLYVKQNNEIPKKTHNLLILSQDVKITHELTEEHNKLFNLLLLYYLGSRYPDKRDKLVSECSQEFTVNTFNKTIEVCLWLKKKF